MTKARPANRENLIIFLLMFGCLLLFFVLLSQVNILGERREYCESWGFRNPAEKTALNELIVSEKALRFSCEQRLATMIYSFNKNAHDTNIQLRECEKLCSD